MSSRVLVGSLSLQCTAIHFIQPPKLLWPYRASKLPSASGKTAALDIERVYTPRSAAVITSAVADLHHKLASGNKGPDQSACTPVMVLQVQGQSAKNAPKTRTVVV